MGINPAHLFKAAFRAALVSVMVLFLLASCTEKPAHQPAQISEDNVSIGLSALKEGKPVFYSYHHEGGRTDFFVLLVNGVPESYLDACFKCSPRKKGFSFKDGNVICNACGESYPVDSLKGVGSCYPIPLKGRTEGGRYVIEASDLIKAGRFF